jgi:hypothetical protein
MWARHHLAAAADLRHTLPRDDLLELREMIRRPARLREQFQLARVELMRVRQIRQDRELVDACLLLSSPSMSTFTHTAAWPKRADVDRIAQALYDGITPLDDLTTRIGIGLVDLEPDFRLREEAPPPTWEDAGILGAIVHNVEQQAEVIDDYLQRLGAMRDTTLDEIGRGEGLKV